MNLDIQSLATPIGIAILYLTAINLVTFLLFGIDKRKAIKGAYRIPEARLHLFALLGGFAGGLIAMQVFKHKRRKPSFLIVFALATLVSASAIVYCWVEFLV